MSKLVCSTSSSFSFSELTFSWRWQTPRHWLFIWKRFCNWDPALCWQWADWCKLRPGDLTWSPATRLPGATGTTPWYLHIFTIYMDMWHLWHEIKLMSWHFLCNASKSELCSPPLVSIQAGRYLLLAASRSQGNQIFMLMHFLFIVSKVHW